MLPAGDLRDVKSSIKRADNIIVTKCSTDLSEEEREQHYAGDKSRQRRISKVYFTEIVYNTPYHLFTQQPGNINSNTDILLLTGIANPKPLKEFLNRKVHSYDMLRYPDHHIFSSEDLKEIIKAI